LAKQGVANSQAVLGSMYAHGEGVLRDILKAYAWSSIAAAQGYTEAKVNRKAFGEYSRDHLPPGNRDAAIILSETYWKLYVVPFN
jgi:TPR repeat protein